MDNQSISSILNGDEPEVEETEVVEAEVETTAEAEPEKAEQPRGPDGKFLPKGEEQDAPPASEEPVFDGKATLAERRKRQEAEQRIAALEAQLQQLTNPPQAAPSVWEDEQGFAQHLSGQITQNSVSQATFLSKLQNSEMLAAQSFDDFEAVWDDMNTFLGENPAIANQAVASRHPWAFAYKAFKNNRVAAELGATDVESLRAKIRAEVEEELRAAQPAPAAIPASLANAQSGRGIVPQAPTSLSDILNS